MCTNHRGNGIIHVCAKGLTRPCLYGRIFLYHRESVKPKPPGLKAARLEILRSAMECVDPALPNGEGLTPLHHSCIRPNKAAFKLLLSHPKGM